MLKKINKMDLEKNVLPLSSKLTTLYTNISVVISGN